MPNYRTREISCPVFECEGKTYKEGKPLTQHMNQVHDLTLEEMQEQYPDIAETFYWGSTLEHKRKPDNSAEFKLPQGDFEEAVLFLLTKDERKYYWERYDFYFQSVDRDPGCIPDIRVLILGEISLQKLQANAIMPGLTEAKKKQLRESIKSAEGDRDKIMARLAISRKAQLDNKTQVKSSPGCLIAAYEKEVTRMSPDQLQAFHIEAAKAVELSRRNIQLYVADVPEDAVPEKDIPTDVSLDLDALIREAGL